MKLTFRPYQEKLVLQVKHHLNNGGDALIEQHTAQVYTFVEHNTKFIKTAADGRWNNNLDNLPICNDCSLPIWV